MSRIAARRRGGMCPRADDRFFHSCPSASDYDANAQAARVARANGVAVEQRVNVRCLNGAVMSERERR